MNVDERISASLIAIKTKPVLEQPMHENSLSGGLHEGIDSGMPLVSVAIACYNQARFLSAAIESVLAQTYPNFEIIIVNDGSTDNSAEVAAQYQGAQYIHQPNQGLSAARNTGLRHSQGEYIVFLDADDRLLPRAVEIGVLCLTAYRDCAFASGHFRYINADGSLRHQYQQDRVERDHYLALLRGNYIGMHAAVIYRRNVFDEVGLFDTTLRACEDYDLYLRIARRFPVFCHDEVITEYRQHTSNMSDNPDVMLEQVLSVLRRQWPHVRRHSTRIRAYGYGLLAWQAHYGKQFFERAAIHSGGGYQQATQMLATALRRTPLYTSYHAANWLYGRGYQLLYTLLSPRVREKIARQLYKISVPSVGAVRLGKLRRLRPIAQTLDPALHIDQYYVDRFVARHTHYLHGQVLHIGNPINFSTDVRSRINRIESLPLNGQQEYDLLLDDLSCAKHLQENSFDCILLIHLLHRVYDLHAALQTLYHLLKPGGVLIATLPGIGLVKQAPTGEAGYWSFTDYSAQMLFSRQFCRELVHVVSKGNVLASVAWLHGVSVQDLSEQELAFDDPQFQLVITVRAIKEQVGDWQSQGD